MFDISVEWHNSVVGTSLEKEVGAFLLEWSGGIAVLGDSALCLIWLYSDRLVCLIWV